jgi:hypothetical protein
MNGDYNFKRDEIALLRIICQVFGAISIAGSFLIFIIFWFFKENRSFKLELVLWYSLSNFLFSITAFFPFDPDGQFSFWCKIQSLFISWFQIGCQLWTCIIGYVAFISVIKKNHIENNKLKYRIGFVLAAFLVSLSLASMLVIKIK